MFIKHAPADNTYDLVVVGTGFGSLFYLQKYRELNPRARILVLEWGKHHTREWQMEHGHNSDVGYTDSYVRVSDDQKTWRTTIGLGGGTNCWWGLTPRMGPNDFKMKSRYGVGVDWPVTYEDLIPHYREAEDIMRISGPSDLEYRYKGTAPYPQPSHRLSTPDEIIKAANPDRHFAIPSARLRIAENGRGPCCSTSRCNLCPVDAKFTALNSMIYLLEADNTFVMVEARVTHFDIEGNTVKAVHYTHGGQDHTAIGDQVILGANAIQSPHILMKSGMDHPALGRYLHEKLPAVYELLLDGVDSFDGGQASTGINYALYDSADRSRHGAAAIFTENRWTTGLRTEYGRWRQVLPVLVVVEDIPQSTNRVTLGEGDLPLVDHPDWSPYAYEGLKIVESQLEAALAPLPIEGINLVRKGGTNAHIQGTLRMGDDPAQSIVDKDLVHHSVRNLTCVGTSVWASCSVSNPSLTAAALSLKAAQAAHANLGVL